MDNRYQMNFTTYKTNPGYNDLIFDLVKAVRWYYRDENWGDYKFPQSFFHDIKRYFNLPYDACYPVLYIGLFFTILRYAFEIVFCKVS
jgi:hypothetical protein